MLLTADVPANELCGVDAFYANTYLMYIMRPPKCVESIASQPLNLQYSKLLQSMAHVAMPHNCQGKCFC